MARPRGPVVVLWALLFVAALWARAHAADCPRGTIHAIAGGGFYENKPALTVPLGRPAAVAVAADGTIYIADTSRGLIWKLDAAGKLIIVAGKGDARAGIGDGGPAVHARLLCPGGLALGPDGSLYIADDCQHRIRKIDPAGVITTVAGNGEWGYSGDGEPATKAAIGDPRGVAAGADGTLYIADSANGVIRKVDPAGIVTTIAGNGEEGYSGDGGLAIRAGLNRPSAVLLAPDGSLYIADTFNSRIRKVNRAGIITTIAGNGAAGQCERNLPEGIKCGRFAGDGGPASGASLFWPQSMALGRDGSLYIGDTHNRRVRKVDTNGIITTAAGDGETDYAGDGGPAIEAGMTVGGVAIDARGNLCIADTGNHRVRKVDTAGIITTIAGNGDPLYVGDGGPAVEAQLGFPSDVALGPDGSLYIADAGASRIRKVAPTGIITTIAGNGQAAYSGDGGPAGEASLTSPTSIALAPDGSLYISGNRRVRKVDRAGIITTVAGDGKEAYSGDGGPATAATLDGPSGVAVGPDGSLYIADFENQRVRKVDAAGIITTVAGDGWEDEWGLGRFAGDGGPATAASLNGPRDVAVGPDGSLYIADFLNHRVRKIGRDGIITTVAGNGDDGDTGDGGPAPWAAIGCAQGLAVGPDGALYITALLNGRVRRVDRAGIITTVAGRGKPVDDTLFHWGEGGPAARADLSGSCAVAVGTDGTLYIVESGPERAPRIRAVCP